MRNLILVFVLVSSLLFLIGCDSDNSKKINETSGNDEVISEKDKEISKLRRKVDFLQKEIESKDFEIKKLSEKGDYYRKFIDSVLPELSEERIIKISNSELWYTLELKTGSLKHSKGDSITIPTDGKLKIDESNFVLALAEKKSTNRILTEDSNLYNKFKINNLKNHIKIINYDNYEVKENSTETVNANNYYFEKVEAGSTIEVNITEELKNKLRIDTTTIEIIVE